MEKPELILLAIDDIQILQLFERALAAASFKTAIARNRAALDSALQEFSPGLVIINQFFSQNDELAIASSILERFPTLPILLFLGQPSPDTLKKAIHIGVSDCLYAPLKIDQITLTVVNSLKRANHLGDWVRREVRATTASLQRRVDELQKFDTILEHIEDGVILLDDNLNVLLVNAAACRTFGLWHDDDVNGKPVMEVLPHPDLKALLQKGVDNPAPHNEVTFDDGRVLSAQSAPIPGIGVAITMQDITYLKQVDRLKNEFVNTVSHDLRSPLTAVLGYVDLLERVGPLNDQQKGFIRRVQVSVESITSLVNDLLELGRIEAGFDSQNELVPLEGMLRYSLETMGGQVAEKRLNMHFNLPAELSPMRGNPIRLRQMLDNLVGNAIKYTPENGDITIEWKFKGSRLFSV